MDGDSMLRSVWVWLVGTLGVAACGGTSGSGEGGADAASPAADAAVDVRGPVGSDSGSLPESGALPDASSPMPWPDAPADAPPAGDDAAADGSGNDGASACGVLPTGGLYATFAVGADVFHASITNASGIANALALWHGTSTAAIPSAPLICTPAAWNCPWHWHMDPAMLDFADTTIEVCDGTPSYVDANCATFGGGQYCPWSAKLTGLQDCRTDPSCPDVPK